MEYILQYGSVWERMGAYVGVCGKDVKMGKDYYGIAIRMTDKRNSFLTAEDELEILEEKIKEKGKAFYASELPINAGKIDQIRFVVFFDAARDLYYLGEIEKLDYKKTPFRPMDSEKYGSDRITPHKTWILINSLYKIDRSCLDYIFVVGGNPEENNTLANKIKEPRFPRVYIYISKDVEKYDAKIAIAAFYTKVGARFTKNAFGERQLGKYLEKNWSHLKI